MAHKSFSSINARRVRAEAAILTKAQYHYARAMELEMEGKDLQARIEAVKGRKLMRRAHASGKFTDGPVGKLPNPKGDLSWEAAEKLGILKRAGITKPSTQPAQPRLFTVTWHSSLKNKRVGFIRPIAADNKSDAITQARAMIDNDPKAKAFLAREMKRNGIVEAAAGLQALEYLGGKVKRTKVGRAPKFNPKRHGSRDALGVWHADAVENPRTLLANRYRVTGTQRRTKFYLKPDGLATGFPESAMEFAGPDSAQRAANKENASKVWGFKWKIERFTKPVTANPSVTEVSRMFQGEANGAITRKDAPDSAPADLARIGRFVFLKLDNGHTLRIPRAMVAADTKGKLWIVGKGPLLSRKAHVGERLDYGEIAAICYDTAKSHIGGGKRYEYVHDFGENGGKRPRLLVDHEGMPLISGGDYKIEARGIVN